MHVALRDLAHWDRLPAGESESVARALDLPGFEFVRIAFHAQGGASRNVAFFRRVDGAEFALVPGGELVLGYDGARPSVFEEAALESWAETVVNYGFPPLEEHLAMIMLPARTLHLPALLVETSPRPVGSVTSRLDHSDVLSALKKEGCRLLTSDEWEHACRAGTRSLWRWGDAGPVDEIPYGDVQFAEWKRPNAFGLTIAQNPFDSELLMDPKRTRGGDGGEAICGGYGCLAAWLTCASAYMWPWFETSTYEECSTEWFEDSVVRRAVPIG